MEIGTIGFCVLATGWVVALVAVGVIMYIGYHLAIMFWR